MSDFTVDVHGADTPEALPAIAEDVATRLGLTGVENQGGIKRHGWTVECDAFHAYSVDGRDANGRRVYITAYNT